MIIPLEMASFRDLEGLPPLKSDPLKKSDMSMPALSTMFLFLFLERSQLPS